MPIQVIERPRRAAEAHFKRPTASRNYLVSGTLDENVAIFNVMAVAPALIEGIDTDTGATIYLFRGTYKTTELGGGKWEVTVSYVSSQDNVDIVMTFGTQSKKVYQAVATVERYDAIDGGSITTDGDFQNIPDFKGAIGVNGDKVEGVDIESGKIEFSVTKKWRRATLSADYINQLFDFGGDRGAINHELYTLTWKGQTLSFEAGSLRLRNVTMKQNSEEELELTYNFAYSSPITTADNFTVGSSDPIEAAGWDYVWVHYKSTTAAGRTVKTPVAVVVDQVYYYKDFALLGI